MTMIPEQVTNEEMLDRITDKGQLLWECNQSRRDKIEHIILKQASPLQTIIEGDVIGKNS